MIEILASGAKSGFSLVFLEDFNGRSFFFGDVWETSQSLQLYTDLADSIALGRFLVAIGFMEFGRAIGKLITSCF